MFEELEDLERWNTVSDDAIAAGLNYDEACSQADHELWVADHERNLRAAGYQDTGVGGVIVRYEQYGEQIWGSLLVKQGEKVIPFSCGKQDWESARRSEMIAAMIAAAP